MIYYKYWCKSDSDRKYYLELLAKNEDLYEEQLKQNDYSNIFSNKEPVKEEINQELLPNKIEENPFKRLLLKIKSFFKR